jgi:hypothetical protein
MRTDLCTQAMNRATGGSEASQGPPRPNPAGEEPSFPASHLSSICKLSSGARGVVTSKAALTEKWRSGAGRQPRRLVLCSTTIVCGSRSGKVCRRRVMRQPLEAGDDGSSCSAQLQVAAAGARARSSGERAERAAAGMGAERAAAGMGAKRAAAGVGRRGRRPD